MSSKFNSSVHEFPAWGAEMKAYCQSLLASLPPSQEMDRYVEEHDLTQSFVPYTRVEGDLSQIVQRVGNWSQVAVRFYQKLSKRAYAFVGCRFCISRQETIMQIDLILDFVSPRSTSFDDDAPETFVQKQVLRGQVFAFSPAICLIFRIATDRYVAYIPIDEGFDRLFGTVTGDFPATIPRDELYSTTDWHQLVKRLPVWLNRLLTLRSTNYYIDWGGIGEPSEYEILACDSARVEKELSHWFTIAQPYAQRALDINKWYTAVRYSVHSSLYELSVGVGLEYSDEVYGPGVNNNGRCIVFRVSKYHYQMLLHTESYLQKQEWERSASVEELIKAGYDIEIL